VFLEQATICFAALTCRWKQNGESFVVGMSGKQKDACLEVCQYQEMTREWRGRPIGRRKIKSSVLCVAFQPPGNGVYIEGGEGYDLVACGGCDYRCRIFCVSTEQDNFGNQLAEFNTNGGGWVTGVNWSGSGRTLAFSSQNSNVYIVDFSTRDEVTPFVVSLQPCLPLCDLVFYGEDQIIVGGYDGKPLLLEFQEERWCLSNKIMGTNMIKQKKDSITAGISCLKKMKLHAGASDAGSMFLSASGADGSFNIYGFGGLRDEK
jgi:WD40 repeat protein